MKLQTILEYIVLAAATICISSSHAEDSALPSADKLFSTYASKVYKGVDLNNFSLSQKGKVIIEQFGIEGPIEIKYKGPDKYSIYIDIFGTEIIRGCNAGQCWAQEFGGDMKLLQGDQLQRRLEGGDFGRFAHMNRYYNSLETVELTTLNEQAAYKIKGVRKTGQTVFFFFSKDTGNFIGDTEVEEDGSEYFTYMSNFNIIDKALLASDYFEGGGQQESLTVFTNFSFADIPDSAFVPPAGLIQSPE